MKKKKALAALLCLALILPCLAGAPARAEGKKLKVVATVFPVYDWAREIIGESDHAELTLLLGKGVDLHSFHPGARDMMQVATADVFIYVGGESDLWVKDALAEAVRPDQIAVNLMETPGLALRDEEYVEGMQREEEEEEALPDEHIWLSVRNAMCLTEAIAEALAQADPDCAEIYRANAAAYTEKLRALDAAYTEAVSEAKYDTLLFGDRFPFRYLTEDYGLNYYAAFAGCSAESEAGFETIVFLAKKLDELGLPAVLTIENSDPRVARTVISASRAKNQRILVLDSMQGTKAEDAEDGTTWLSVMESNLQVLREALN